MLTVVSSNLSPVVTRHELKQYLRVNVPDDDAMLDAMLVAAQEAVEHDTATCLQLANIVETFPRFPYPHDYGIFFTQNVKLSKVRLTKRPLVSVSSIIYYDTNNVQQTLSTSNYTVSAPTNTHGYVTPINTAWPTTYNRQDAVAVTYVAGYSQTPFRLLQAIKVWAWGQYHHEDVEEQYRRLVMPLQTSPYPA